MSELDLSGMFPKPIVIKQRYRLMAPPGFSFTKRVCGECPYFEELVFGPRVCPHADVHPSAFACPKGKDALGGSIRLQACLPDAVRPLIPQPPPSKVEE